jgi:hypothetical protein
MAVETPVANNKQVKSSSKAAQAPPTGTFWRKYSAHHELPLSVSSSVFLHILGFVLLGGFLLAFLGLNRDKELPVDAITVGGGGGNREGVGNNPGSGVLPSNEAVENKDRTQPDKVVENLDKELLKKPEARKPELPVPDPSGVRPIEDTSVPDKNLSALGTKLRAQLSGPIAGKGEGGPGSGGGQGSGKGTGKGNAFGPGTGKLTQREKRQQRWLMLFNTRSGNDYADQLMGLGAILAINTPSGEYLIIRDLANRPVHGQVEDIRELNRIFWVDDKPQSVSSLAMALGIRPVPEQIIAFFPPELEKDLLDKEMKAFRGREEDIAETVFKVDRRGNRFEPMVVNQKRR